MNFPFEEVRLEKYFSIMAETPNDVDIDVAPALEHNRSFQIKNNSLNGCHSLHSLLEAQSRGLVVAAVSKLPGDDLPEGVYGVQVTCRLGVDNPDSGQNQDIVSYSKKVWEMARCTANVCVCTPDRAPVKCSRRGILFKFRPSLKTVFNPELWPDERLARLCKKAYKDADKKKRCKQKGDFTYWEGKATENGNEYWMAGQVGNVKKVEMRTFYFIPSEYRQWPNID